MSGDTALLVNETYYCEVALGKTVNPLDEQADYIVST
jgi:hypothetical protein